MSALLEAYDGVLLDAYGVLVDARGPLPGATALIDELNRRAKPYAVVTNDASRSVATYVARFASFGLAIPGDRIVTSGSLLPAYFRERGLAGARTCVLGTDDSYAFVVEGGGVPVEVTAGMEIDAVAICDDAGTPFLDGIELAFSAIARAVDAGRRPALVVPNPDLVYPKGDREYGFTAGAMALLVETALARRFPHDNLVFDHLGKPEPHLFHEGARRIAALLESRDAARAPRIVMIGDQLETDIAGALGAGLDAALLAGVSRWTERGAITPTYVLPDLVKSTIFEL